MIREWAFVFFGDKPLYLCCWVFCLGMALAYWGIFSVLPLIAFLITAIIAVMIAFLSKKWPWLLIAFCFLGAFYWHSGWNQPESLPFAPGSSLEVEGEIIGNPSYKENKFTVLLRPQKINGQKYHENKLQIMGEGKVPVLAGDTVLVRGKLLEDNPYGNSNAFDYGQYLWRQGITGVISTLYNGEIVVKSHGSRLNPSVLMGKLNNRLDKALDFLPDQQKSYVEGVFLGKKSDLSFYDKKILTETGLLHAFSVSGLHIGYIVLLIGFLLGRDQQKKLVFLLLSMGILFFYLFLVGFGTAVLRAFLMSLTVLLAQYFNEKSDMQTSLALVAVLMLLWNPALLFDAAFQLSFVSVLGMSYLMPVFSGFFPVKNYWTESLAITFSASWAIMPLIAYYFYLLSFSSWLLAPLVLVLIGLVVMISFVAAFLAIFSITLAVLPLYACGFLMDMVIKLCYLAADLPLSWISIGKPPLYILAIYYFLLLLIPLFWHQKRKKAVIIMLLSSLCLLIIPLGEKAVYDQQSMPVWAEEDDCLEVVFLDIGQGDCCIIHTPLDKLIIIDAGGKRTDPQWMGKYIVLPYLQSRGWDKMDLIISSHPHEDHLGGLLPILQTMPVNTVLTADVYEDNPLQGELIALAQQEGTKIVYGGKGDKFLLEDGLYLEILAPDDIYRYDENNINSGSLVCKISYGQIDFLLTGDIEGDALSRLTALPIQSEILKIPHHGSHYSYDEQFYQKVSPWAAIISVGRNNSFGHPASIVEEYWQEANIPLYRTDQDGSVTFFTDGKRIFADSQLN